MATASKAGLQKFGLTVGGVFLLLGVVNWARGHSIPPRVLWTLRALLVVPGIVDPNLLGSSQYW